MALTMEGNAESSNNMGHERANSYGETVGPGQLRWEEECRNVTFPFVILGVTVFGSSWREGQKPTIVGREATVLEKESACLFPGIPS